MMHNRPLTVFSYSFPHKKTYDFLVMLKVMGFTNVCVIAAPKVNLKQSENSVLFNTIKTYFPALDTKELCDELGYEYLHSAHDNVALISEFIEKYQCNTLALIVGARIIKKDIISLFNIGIVNLHPGEIPQTSGLDSFYWMIKNDARPGTTVHFIDPKVDAGDLIFFHNCQINEKEDAISLTHKLYENQKEAFARLLRLLKTTWLLKTSTINRPAKNLPMAVSEKKEVLENLTHWSHEVFVRQENKNFFFEACKNADLEAVKLCLDRDLLEEPNNFGWTALIVAAFNQNKEIVEFLIKKGASVTASNNKNTTVLMYAKTGLLNHTKSKDLSIIKLLIDAGADLTVKDVFNKDIFDYINESGFSEVSTMIKDIPSCNS